MKRKIMPIVRKDISEKVISHLNKKQIIFLWGEVGVGKSFLAKAVANNISIKNNSKYFFIECVDPENKDNEPDKIYNFESFLSYILLKVFNKKITPSYNHNEKRFDVKTLLLGESTEFIFVFDDFHNLNEAEQKRIFDFIKDENLFTHQYFIFTSTSKPKYHYQNPDLCFIKEIGMIQKSDFNEICKFYINTINNSKLKENVRFLRKSVGRKVYYDFVYEQSHNDLRLMHDIHQALVIQIFNENNKLYNKEKVKNYFNEIRGTYRITRNTLLENIIKRLSSKSLYFLQTISLFETPVSKTVLTGINDFDEYEIQTFEKECENLYLFDDFMNKEETLVNEKKEILYYLTKTLKDALEEERSLYDDRIQNPYLTILNNWIEHYKKFSAENSQKLNYSLSFLDFIKNEFINISKVLEYCYLNKRFDDYYYISDNIWYFCELNDKDIDEYHYKRFEIALALNDNKKIFDSALHYCNNAYKIGPKKRSSNNYKNCLNELENRCTSIENESKRLFIKYIYTKALELYHWEKKFKEAEKLFAQCEEILPLIIKQEKNNNEKIQLVKDFISVVKWHCKCFIDNGNEHSIEHFFELNNVIECSIAYEMNYKIDYSRVISSILLSRIKLLLKFKERIPNVEQKIKNDFSIIQYFEKIIEEDCELPKEYDVIKKILKDYGYIQESLNKYNVKNYLKDSKLIINKTLNDETQKKIIPILKETRDLFLLAIKKECNTKGKVSITAMPDLGLANNVIRMSGGFYTGMFIEWDSEIPIIPIDSTINSCGVAIYSLKREISISDFEESFKNIDDRLKNELGYNWNFERGNHFITLGKIENGDYCIIMHGSADEYKNNMGDKSLYPPPKGFEKISELWYAKYIKKVTSLKNKHRYLRYITGEIANKFISIAIRLETVNHIRMQEISKFLFKEYISNELIFIPHYGMPSNNSIAIGCSWENQQSVLLTAPGKDIYIIEQKDEHLKNNDDYWLTPHGLGVSASIESIKYKNGLYINHTLLKELEDAKSIKGRTIRCREDNLKEFNEHIKLTLSNCNAEIKYIIHPLATISADGFKKISKDII